MTQTDAPGPRITAAKAAARGLLDALPDTATIALETYGTKTGSAESDKPAGCRDVTTLIPLGPLDKAAMGAAVDSITPAGYTPISLALQSAAAQLPADNSPQAIVLVSDGEDTCDTSPCDTAAQLKKSHPGLTISTVGFKVVGPAAGQLRCIAEATGGLAVQASNANQLAARLLATQDLTAANAALTNVGLFGLALGASSGDIRSKYADFPDVAPKGAVSVVWRDCDFGFVDGVLNAIRPHQSGRTIDGVIVGGPVSKAVDLYGPPLESTTNKDGTLTVTFDADPSTDAAYRIGVDPAGNAGGALSGTITTITLCRCKPRSAVTRGEPERIVLKPVDGQGNTMPGYLKDERQRDQVIDCSSHEPSPYDVTRGVRFCGATADSGDACWPTAGDAYVLCLPDPFKKVLTLRAAEGADTDLDPLSAPARPIGIELEDGTTCRARNGGAWSAQDQHPDFVGYFGCTGGTVKADWLIAWGPRDGDDGISKGPDGWTVQIGGTSGPLSTRRVTKIYFVGVA